MARMASMVVKKTLEVEEAAKEHPFFVLNTLSCPSFIDRPYSKLKTNKKRKKPRPSFLVSRFGLDVVDRAVNPPNEPWI